MACHKCKKKKENLLLPNPQDIDKDLLEEYRIKKDNRQLTTLSVFEYFNTIYQTAYPYNPKQVRRALINMDHLYLQYTRGQLVFEEPVQEKGFDPDPTPDVISTITPTVTPTPKTKPKPKRKTKK